MATFMEFIVYSVQLFINSSYFKVILKQLIRKIYLVIGRDYCCIKHFETKKNTFLQEKILNLLLKNFNLLLN